MEKPTRESLFESGRKMLIAEFQKAKEEVIDVCVCSEHLRQLLNCRDLNEVAEKLRGVLATPRFY